MNNAARALGAAVLLGFASSALARHHGTAAASAATVPDPTTTTTAAADIRYDDQLSGTWKNELGSVLRLRARGGLLSGTYESAVGNTTGAYNLTGAYVSPRSDDDGGGATAPLPLSFVVHFRNELRDARSVTAWTGHATGDQRLDMLWTLASEPATADALWASTRVNKNTFVKARK